MTIGSKVYVPCFGSCEIITEKEMQHNRDLEFIGEEEALNGISYRLYINTHTKTLYAVQ